MPTAEERIVGIIKALPPNILYPAANLFDVTCGTPPMKEKSIEEINIIRALYGKKIDDEAFFIINRLMENWDPSSAGLIAFKVLQNLVVAAKKSISLIEMRHPGVSKIFGDAEKIVDEKIKVNL